jgi:multiple sugar transport system permease protein
MSTLAPGRDAPAAIPVDQGGRARTTGAGGSWWIYVLLGIGLLLLVGPFIWMILGSFKTTGELRQVPPTWLPEEWSLQN